MKFEMKNYYFVDCLGMKNFEKKKSNRNFKIFDYRRLRFVVARNSTVYQSFSVS